MILLQLSATAFLVPVAYFLLYTPEKPAKKSALAAALVVIFASSQLFWYNPVKNSIIHRFDALIAKIIIAGFILYTLLYTLRTINQVISYIALMGTIGITAFVGDRQSSKKWCSVGHIYSHALLHILGAIGATYAFI